MTHSTPVPLLILFGLLIGCAEHTASNAVFEPGLDFESPTDSLVLTMLRPAWIDPHSDAYVAHAMYNTAADPPDDPNDAMVYYQRARHAIVRVTDGERRSMPITYHGRHLRCPNPDQLLLRETDSRLVLRDWTTGARRTLWDAGESIRVVDFTIDGSSRLVALVTEDENDKCQVILLDLVTNAERRIDCGVRRMIQLASGPDFVGFVNGESWVGIDTRDPKPSQSASVMIVRPSDEVDTGFIMDSLESHKPIDPSDDLIGFLGETPVVHNFDERSVEFGVHAIRWEGARPAGYAATGAWAGERRAVTLFTDDFVTHSVVLLRENGEAHGIGSVSSEDIIGISPVNDGQLAIVTRDGFMRVYRVDGTQRVIEIGLDHPFATQ